MRCLGLPVITETGEIEMKLRKRTRLLANVCSKAVKP